MSLRYGWIFILFLAASIGATPSAFAATALSPGVPAPLSLPAGKFVPNLYIDVDASAQQLNINLVGSGGACEVNQTCDLDLFVRYGSPFPDPNNATWGATAGVSYDMLLRYGHYHSISSASNESVSVLPSAAIPLAAGRWYIAVINGGTTATTATLTATPYTTVQTASISLDFANPSTDATDATNNCEVTPWSDTTAATPVGGNPGTTRGDQRKNALQFAVNELAQQLQSPVPLTVHACWAHLGGDNNRATLAHATSNSLAFDDTHFPMPWLGKKYTWYTETQIARMGGTSGCGAFGGDCSGALGDVVEITFNSDIGTAGVIGGNPFYLGYSADTSTSSSDFISIAMHEITHGLGFISEANTDPSAGPIGARAGITDGSSTVTYQNYTEGPWDDIFGDNTALVGNDQLSYLPFFGYELLSQPNNAARAAAMTSGNVVTATDAGSLYTPTLLRWSDPLAVNSSANQSTGNPPRNFPSLYAPCDITATTACSTSPGSTLSHIVQRGDLMNAFYPFPPPRTMGLAAPMLAAMGWSNAAAPAPVYSKPFPTNWYDRTHSGHGIDFRLVGHNADYGDIYFLTFYTYSASGAVEWYQAQGFVVDGVFIPVILGADGSTLVRMHYDATKPGASPEANTGGSIVIDFNQAKTSPACRNVDRSSVSLLAVMSWSFADTSGNVTEQGDWCIEPLSLLSQNAAPNLGGLWYVPGDSGWGMAILDLDRGSAGQQVAFELYYPDASGNPIWATANVTPFVSGQPIPLMANSTGYCRTCTPVAQHQTQVGTITLTFGSTNLVSIQANYPGGGSFTRNNATMINGGLFP
jgi:hypothetical protein